MSSSVVTADKLFYNNNNNDNCTNFLSSSFSSNGCTIVIVDYCSREGAFKITGLPSASYVVEVSHPTYVFPPVRVDINSKGTLSDLCS